MANISLTGLLEQRKRVFYGWWIVTAGAIQDALKGGTFNEGMFFYFLPFERDLGISRTQISLLFSLNKLEGAFEGPIVGHLIDRLGPRIMVAVGAILSGLGFILLSFTHSYIYLLLVFVGVLSFGFKAGYNHAMMAAVNQWFIKKKGLAMSLVSTGQSVGGLLIAPFLVAPAIFIWGWRPIALFSGIAILLLVLPLALVVRRSPESMGLLPDGEKPRRDSTGAVVSRASQASAGVDFTTGEAVRTPAFWIYTVAHALRNFAHGGINVHLVPIMVWQGVDEENARYFVAFMFFIVIPLRLLMGFIGDLWSRQKLLAMGVGLAALGLVVLWRGSGQWWQIAIFVFLLAGADSTNSMAHALVGDLFGRKNFATIRGWIGLIQSLFAMGAPVFAGWIYDKFESYTLVIIPFIAAYLYAAVLFWAIPKPRPPARTVPQPHEAQATIGEP